VNALTGREEALVTVRQAHTAKAIVLETPWMPDRAPVADAIVTRARGVVLGVLSADCAPVLVADEVAGVIGAIHAGWRGALGGVIEAAVSAMEKLGAKAARMRAAVGPCIRESSYEVGPELARAFTEADAAFDRYFRPAGVGDRLLFDLAGFAVGRLAFAGVTAADVVEGDTFAEGDRFFSYRRNQKSGEDRYGRGLSAIARL
jgi:YfiH family protein